LISPAVQAVEGFLYEEPHAMSDEGLFKETYRRRFIEFTGQEIAQVEDDVPAGTVKYGLPRFTAFK
jgi:hypothetical protein